MKYIQCDSCIVKVICLLKYEDLKSRLVKMCDSYGSTSYRRSTIQHFFNCDIIDRFIMVELLKRFKFKSFRNKTGTIFYHEDSFIRIRKSLTSKIDGKHYSRKILEALGE